MRWLSVIVVLLTGCAATKPLPLPEAAGTEPATVAKLPARTAPRPGATPPPRSVEAAPTPRPTPKPTARPAPKPSQPEPPPTPKPPGFEKLVQAGSVESAGPGQVVFVPQSAPGNGTPGLFEDAITLNGVRARLKPILPEGAADGARVEAGVVTLSLPGGLSPADAAAAVDATLRAEGVRKVVVERPAQP